MIAHHCQQNLHKVTHICLEKKRAWRTPDSRCCWMPFSTLLQPISTVVLRLSMRGGLLHWKQDFNVRSHKCCSSLNDHNNMTTSLSHCHYFTVTASFAEITKTWNGSGRSKLQAIQPRWAFLVRNMKWVRKKQTTGYTVKMGFSCKKHEMGQEEANYRLYSQDGLFL